MRIVSRRLKGRFGLRVYGRAVNQGVLDGYRRFACREAHGVSPTYEDWAEGIAADPELVELIAALPRNKQSRT